MPITIPSYSKRTIWFIKHVDRVRVSNKTSLTEAKQNKTTSAIIIGTTSDTCTVPIRMKSQSKWSAVEKNENDGENSFYNSFFFG